MQNIGKNVAISQGYQEGVPGRPTRTCADTDVCRGCLTVAVTLTEESDMWGEGQGSQ